MAAAMTLVTDARTTHYWDGHSATIKGYTATFDLPEDAWDIYMIYGPDARWEGAVPPKPLFWMHQLGSRDNPRVDGPYFDIDVFTKRVNKVLQSK